MSYKIFVQIASYRDPELIPTIYDLVEKADNANSLKIIVAWQHDDNESIIPIQSLFDSKKYNGLKIEMIDIPYTDSKGVCWARNLIRRKYRGE